MSALPRFIGDEISQLCPGRAERSLEEFLLSANCQGCGKLIKRGESYIIAGNPSVLWKFHDSCYTRVPYKVRQTLDVYGGERYGEGAV